MPGLIEVPLWCAGLGLLITVIGRFKNLIYGSSPLLPFWQEWTVYSCGVVMSFGLYMLKNAIL